MAVQIPVLIIEDNKAAVTALVSHLSDYSELKILDTVSTISDALDAVDRCHPVLMFIDVELPDGNGIEFYESIRDRLSWNAYVVFYTAFEQYTINALRAHAHDYILKPVVKTEIQDVMRRFYLHCAHNFVNSDTTIAPSRNINEKNNLLVVDNKNNKVAIRPSDVIFFHYLSDRKVWEVHCADKSSYILHHGINSTRLLQVCADFEQVHKSYIVNVNVISSMNDNNLILISPFNAEGNIPISRLYRNALYNRFCQL